MQVQTSNDVKIYNLSAGKSLPDWLSDRQRRKLEQKNVDVRRRIQLIQDFEMPDVSHTVDVSPDGRYVFATGTYKPFVKCFDLKQMSLKFQRGLDADVIKMKVLSEDYSKFILLEEERYLEMHATFGRYFRLRIPHFGRDMDFSKESSDLFIVTNSSEIFRLNLEQGEFLQPLQSASSALNCCQFSPAHQLFLAGTCDGTVEAYDHRDRKRVGTLDVIRALQHEIQGIAEVTAVQYQSPLQIGVGTSSGHILLYDIRSKAPLLVKDQMMGLPIKKIDFVDNSNGKMVLSMDSRVLKMWNQKDGKPIAAVEGEVAMNDFVRYPKSGLLLFANEAPRMLQYFVPALGPAPKWCSYLEMITEELEETDAPAVYDDYKFVTAKELEAIGLTHLIGTNLLRAYMHGYFMDLRLFEKAKTLTQPFAFDKYKERKIREMVDAQRDVSAVKRKDAKLPKVNKELAMKLQKDIDANKNRNNANSKKKLATAQSLLTDTSDRFSKLFTDADFEVDKDSEAFQRLAAINKNEAEKRRKKATIEEEEPSEGEDEGEDEEEDDEGVLQADYFDNDAVGRSQAEDEDENSSVDGDASAEEVDDEEEDEKEKKRKENKRRADRARALKNQREEEIEREMRKQLKPKKFVLHELDVGETSSKFMKSQEELDEEDLPIAVRRQRMIEEQDGTDEILEDTPFGGKSISFKIKSKKSERKEYEEERAKRHVEERYNERRTTGKIRKMLTPLPGNLVLPGRGGKAVRGRGRGRPRM